jgi:hypothetical protein
MVKQAHRPLAFTSDFGLPATYTAQIGRFIVRWAYLDHHINTILWAVAFNVGGKLAADLGRLALTEKPLEARLRLIRQLAAVRKIRIDEKALKAIESKSKALVEERNLLTHGTWDKEKHRWYVKQTRGEWPGTAKGPKGPKKLAPEAVPRTPAQIKASVAEVERLIEAVMALKQSSLRGSLAPLAERLAPILLSREAAAHRG